MKMKSTTFFVPLMMTIMIAQQTNSTPIPTTTTAKPVHTTTQARTTTPWTTGRPEVNLDGLMATLTGRGGVVSFYPPFFSPDSYYTTTTAPWTKPPSARGLSLCLRYLTDSGLFLTLSSRDSDVMTLRSDSFWYQLDDRWGSTLRLNPSIKILPVVAPDIWTRVCLTMDFTKKYFGQSASVIQFSDFVGQVTDIQMWDYPLKYGEVTDYMNGGVYRLCRGSILSWSSISYSNSGNMLLEDVYEIQAKVPVRGRGCRLRGGKKSSGKGFNMGKSKRQQL